MLSNFSFKVWLDGETFRPKLVYHKWPKAIIDCISSCGMEKAFSSITLKLALNQINVISKPNIFLLDEIMSNLDNESADEFAELLQQMKLSIGKILIVEHVREINPDYVIKVELDENGISSLNLN